MIIDRAMASLALSAAMAGAYAACDSTASSNAEGYRKASDRVTAIAEFKSWYARTRERGSKAIFGAHVDKQTTFERKCYWSVSVYADEGPRLQLWQIFYVPTDAGAVLVVDPTTGEPKPLRSNSRLLTDAYQVALRAPFGAAKPER